MCYAWNGLLGLYELGKDIGKEKNEICTKNCVKLVWE
jgi:hypothetical protein